MTQAELMKLIKEEVAALTLERCGGPVPPDAPETVDLAGMTGDDAFGLAWGNAIDALRAAGMEDAADLLQSQAGGAEASFGEPYEASLGEAKKK